MLVELAARVRATAVEGPGLRYALWVQGCSLRCPGCCNPEMFATGRGTRVAVARLLEEIAAARDDAGIEGITVVGGEPLQQLPALAELAAGVAARDLGVLVYTGYALDEARARPGFLRLWSSLDTLVAGPYDRTQPEPEHDGRRYVGSRNQVLVHRTARYRDPLKWRGSPGAEVHVGADGSLQVCGDPRATAPVLRRLGLRTRA